MNSVGLRPIMIGLIVAVASHSLSGAPTGSQTQLFPNQPTVKLVGVILADDGTPIKNARVLAWPVGGDSETIRAYWFDKDGQMHPIAFEGKSDSEGRFSIEIERDYSYDNQRIRKWTLALPEFSVPDRMTGFPTTKWLQIKDRPLSIEIDERSKSVDLGKIIVR